MVHRLAEEILGAFFADRHPQGHWASRHDPFGPEAPGSTESIGACCPHLYGGRRRREMDTAMRVPSVSVRRQIWTFGRHYLEMCIAMCIGVAVTNFLLRSGPWGADLRQAWPGLSLLAISIGLTLPMAAWMRFRGMDWRPILEMSVAGIAAVMAAAWLGIISASNVAIGTVCGLACVAMFGAMLFRLDMYTGRSGYHHHA
jgi:hypothetical protein